MACGSRLQVAEAGLQEQATRSNAVPVMLVASKYLQACQYARFLVQTRCNFDQAHQRHGNAGAQPVGKVVAAHSVRHSVEREAQCARGLTELSASGKRWGCPSWRGASLHGARLSHTVGKLCMAAVPAQTNLEEVLTSEH